MNVLDMNRSPALDYEVWVNVFNKEGQMRPFSYDISAAMLAIQVAMEKAQAHVDIELFYNSALDGRVTVHDIKDREDIIVPFGKTQRAGHPKTLEEALSKAALLAVGVNGE